MQSRQQLDQKKKSQIVEPTLSRVHDLKDTKFDEKVLKQEELVEIILQKKQDYSSTTIIGRDPDDKDSIDPKDKRKPTNFFCIVVFILLFKIIFDIAVIGFYKGKPTKFDLAYDPDRFFSLNQMLLVELEKQKTISTYSSPLRLLLKLQTFCIELFVWKNAQKMSLKILLKPKLTAYRIQSWNLANSSLFL